MDKEAVGKSLQPAIKAILDELAARVGVEAVQRRCPIGAKVNVALYAADLTKLTSADFESGVDRFDTVQSASGRCIA